MGKVEERWIKTTDNKKMLTWIVYPPHFDPSKKYPAILYCQGGPQQPVSQFWSYRWNLQLMAANGYIVIAPNRRGLYGFGQEWLEQISGDYGGQNMKDYFSATDEMKKEPFFDFTHSDLIQNIFILERDFLYFFALRVNTINFIGLRQRVAHGDQTVVVYGSQ